MLENWIARSFELRGRLSGCRVELVVGILGSMWLGLEPARSLWRCESHRLLGMESLVGDFASLSLWMRPFGRLRCRRPLAEILLQQPGGFMVFMGLGGGWGHYVVGVSRGYLYGDCLWRCPLSALGGSAGLLGTAPAGQGIPPLSWLQHTTAHPSRASAFSDIVRARNTGRLVDSPGGD